MSVRFSRVLTVHVQKISFLSSVRQIARFSLMVIYIMAHRQKTFGLAIKLAKQFAEVSPILIKNAYGLCRGRKCVYVHSAYLKVVCACVL